MAGTCTVTVELAGPAASNTNSINLVPDQIRGMAGYVIQRCPGGGDMTHNYANFAGGLGGYVTSGLENILESIEQSNLYLNPNSRLSIIVAPWDDSRAEFVTVTVQKPTSSARKPGDTDIHTANRILGFARQLWDGENDPQHKNWYWDLADTLEEKIEEMTPDGNDVSWWEPVDPTSTNKMLYTCNNGTDGPAVVDCLKLQYQGLGEGTADLKQGETRYFNQSKCLDAGNVSKAKEKC
ncbi:MAG: hypothetical protein Q9191_006211 [Dirinaria sp. TL-2023a]